MLDQKQLQALLAVYSEGSFLAAARLLNVTPAAVTLRIKALENTIGALVLIRGKTPRLTPQGQVIVAHAQRTRLLDDELMRTLSMDAQSYRGGERWSSLRVAINADSLATWFLPGVASDLMAQNILLDIVIDDQDHTHESLATGEVAGCVTTLSKPMKGCIAEPLGVMRYQGLAHPDLVQKVTLKSGRISTHRLLSRPAIIFNRKDAMHDRFLEKYLELKQPSYPKYFVPALDAFECAIEIGLGWGVVPQPVARHQIPALRPHISGRMVEVIQGGHIEITLYWQHWARESEPAMRLTSAVKRAAQAYLRP